MQTTIMPPALEPSLLWETHSGEVKSGTGLTEMLPFKLTVDWLLQGTFYVTHFFLQARVF